MENKKEFSEMKAGALNAPNAQGITVKADKLSETNSKNFSNAGKDINNWNTACSHNILDLYGNKL